MPDSEHPMKIDPRKQYRVWFDVNENGQTTTLKVQGFITFVAEVAGWGVRVARPGDTEQYFPPGSWNRIAAEFEGPR
jgi:hypothetical protein